MENKKPWLKILVMVMVLVSGITVIGCEIFNEQEQSFLDELDLRTGTPVAALLSEIGLTPEQFTTVRNAAGGGFQGWYIDEGDMVMVWTGRSISNFNSTSTVLNNLFGEYERESEAGIHYAGGDNYELVFFSRRISEEGFYIPEGTILAYIWAGNNVETNYLESLDLNTGTPGTTELTISGLSLEEFNSLRDAAGGGFQGWTIEEGSLLMAWTERNETNFTSAADLLAGLFDEDERDDDGGIYYAGGDDYNLVFFSNSESEGDFYISAGTMIAYIQAGDSVDNYLDSLGLDDGPPPGLTILTEFGLTQEEFNSLLNAAGSGYQGWAIDENDYFVMAWTSRSETDFDDVADLLADLFDEDERYDADGMHYAIGDNYELRFTPTTFSWDGFYVSAETMVLLIRKD